ncbi:DUF6246 family protein [Utexia brackfieldae]|uniref:DUF6246 family protein n=1 Tax=Utexia brackfieldae TaxID=3074108 RepID=UPI00370DD802
MVRVDIGEICIKQKVKGLFSEKLKTFKLVPSFENISKIGDGDEVIKVYSTLIDDSHAQVWRSFRRSMNKQVIKRIKSTVKAQREAAMRVISCCSDDDISSLKLPIDTLINIAAVLLKYGVSGHAKVRVSQRNASKQYKSSFDINQYITNARIHLALSLAEAKKLTMTEYINMMAMKYPDNDGFTAEEYDEVMDAYEKRRKARLEKDKRK